MGRIQSRNPVDELVRIAEGVDVYVTDGEPAEHREATYVVRPMRIQLSDYGTAGIYLVLATLACFAMYPYFNLSNLILVYLLAVMLTATECGRGPAILSSFVSVLAFDFFFVPPRFTFAVGDMQYLVTFAVMLAVALVWLPLERTRVRLEREVPELRAAVQALLRDAEEAKRLRSMAPVAAQSAAPLAALAAGAVAAPPGSRLVLVDPGHLRLTGADVGFTQLLEWLASAAGNHGLRVESAHVEALAAPGRVRVDITLART